jgi:hypothetical protein
MSNDSYGLQRREQIKASLRRIVAAHEQQSQPEQVALSADVHETQTPEVGSVPTPESREQPARSEADAVIARRRGWRPQAEEVKPAYVPEEGEYPIEIDGEVVFVGKPEEHLDRFIAVHTPELQDVLSAGHVYEILTGRIVISWRVRKPEDGTAPWTRGVAKPKRSAPAPTTPGAVRDDLKGLISAEQKAEKDRREWLSRFLRGDRDSLDPHRVSWGSGQKKKPQPEPSDNITSRSRRFANWSRDRMMRGES